jgi:hypothetical protein
MMLEDAMSPLMGPWMHQMLATLCVTLSLSLVALGDSDPTGQFCLATLSFGRLLINHGAHFGYGCHILRCRGCIVWGVRVARKLIFTAPFYITC